MSIVVPTHLQNTAEICCPDCRSTDLLEDYAAADLICTQCGRVVSERLTDTTSEWRTFSNDNNPQKDKSRVGAAEGLSHNQLTTTIGAGKGGKDGASNLSRLQAKTIIGMSEKNFNDAVQEISSMADRMGLTRKIQEQASQLYQAAVKEVKAPTNALVAACIFIACRKEGVPRTFRDICQLTNVPKKEIGRTFKLIRSKVLPNISETTNTVRASDFMDRFCADLGLRSIRRFAAHVSNKASDLGVSGGRPQLTVAATAIYFASQLSNNDLKRSPKEIGDACGVADQTIRQCYKAFFKHSRELVEGVEAEFMKGHTLEELPSV
ncbi:hypothetical protein SARC_05635 [Sphaeroforma arctica JP610]|uniref:General transcription factor TFIIB n=1 Tax=Sphaeroforma arctica JP610 TaxID=667725 RepID=A0A0L0FZR3_9EUKA|nr:hypothetical protein SARC_05635 [Sphaeroforma arctica JP610]KNC82084.1 hypothetical protein SARC_05635 [Sphaeroforma arctica JP610]|eukprot:XP_014155986.1 hypothetical protein SARC_05635 [Sphaeroforma arctica JP610]